MKLLKLSILISKTIGLNKGYRQHFTYLNVFFSSNRTGIKTEKLHANGNITFNCNL